MKNKHYEKLNIDNILKINNLFYATENYSKEAVIINDVLNKFPNNTDIIEVASKVGVIDITNSTNLSRYKSKISIDRICNKILSIKDFDKRVKSGDPTLVNELALNENINLFSFASKYCCYHNRCIYRKDDYSIYDTILKDNIPNYTRKVTKHKISTWRKNGDYESYNNLIAEILDENNIHIENRRMLFDHFIWYPNR